MNGYLKRSGLLAAVLLGWMALTAFAQTASFDCAKAQSGVELVICGEVELSKLDVDLSTAYKAALKDVKQAASIREAQKQWLKIRNACESAECLKTAYVTRLKVLGVSKQRTVAVTSGMIGDAHASYVINGEGKDQPFCEAILAVLNKNKLSDDYLPCMSEEIFKLPGVSDPAWEKLDLSQHEELAKKIMTLSAVGSAEYFRDRKIIPERYPTPEQQQHGLEWAKELGAELFALKLASELFGNRVMVTLRHKDDMCGHPIKLPLHPRGEMAQAAWVTADLKEIATGPGIFDSYAGRPLLYRGRLYLMRDTGSSSGVEIYVPRREYISRVCNISFSINTNSKGEQK